VVLLIAKPGLAQTDTDVGKPGKIYGYKSSELLKLVESAVVSETGSLDELKNRLGRLETLQKAVFTEINAYRIQNSAHSNFLLNPTTPVRDLEKAFNDNQIALKAMDVRLDDFIRRRNTIKEIQQQSQSQTNLSADQKTEIKESAFSKAEKHSLMKVLDNLTQIMTEKQAVLKKLDEALGIIVTDLQGIRSFTYQLSGKFEQQIKLRKSEPLFERKYTTLKVLNGKAVANEISVAAKTFIQPFLKDFWSIEGIWVKNAGTMPLMTLVLFLVLAAMVIVRLRVYCLSCEEQAVDTEHRWRLLCLTLIRRSLFLLVAFLALYAYKIIHFHHYRPPFIRLVLYLLMIALISRWVLDFLKYWQPGEDIDYIQALFPKIRRLTTALGFLSSFYVLLLWALGGNSVILFVERLAIEIGLTAWCFLFWQSFRKNRQRFYRDPLPPVSIATTFVITFTYSITIGGLVMELAGYPALAFYWLVSWGRTLAVAYWTVIFFNVIREWQKVHRQPAVMDDTELPRFGHPVQQLAVQVSWLLWTVAVIVGMILAWSTKPDILNKILSILRYSFSIGQIKMSVMGLIYAVLVLFFTRIFTRLGKYLLKEKVFVESDMEKGLQTSITTISVYLMWGLGLILALSVLGVSATSMAVVFGALSIGIGFGLQNIFNNFISGIILLFERPIQVGDAVEVGGIWGEIKKINVRATVVQTFDNASLIIPNSEFISSQVTNWSFKEPSLRRLLEVGVAYGSDVELVKITLIEIAEQTRNVRKKPKPDVIFLDHGDSALIFRLRYWTTIDHYYTTWSDIRFSIDRLFRERNIEIAFPQRDIHIRSGFKDEMPVEDNHQGTEGTENRVEKTD
ncbi:mechanosensitive ion channel domain-containing protein, partial [Thermodesulfobacteriota bacterium]